MSTTEVKNKACLICIDGWGISDETEGNAVHAADTPVMDKLREEYPYTTLSAHGLDVGLPDGLMGNSEVGHLNIGAGRIVYQDIVRIELAVQNETLGELPALQNAFEHANNESGGRIHFLGLVSDGGVHAHIDHLKALLRTAKAANVPTAFVHFFADGRDTAPTSASGYLADIMKYMQDDIEYGCIADIVGRYYAMDRDTRWERIQVAWEGMTQMNGEETDDPVAVVERRYTEEQTDEFLKPIIVNKEGQIQDNDTLVFIDFRSDRMREITATFGIPEMFNMEIGEDVHVPQNLYIATMTQYKASFPFEVLFAPNKVDNCLSEWISSNGLQQFHTAETEKYAHVTFFFNGGQEAQFKDEEREMVSSPKVATYDLKPDMSLEGVGKSMVNALNADKYQFIMCNLAPPDMVGHTGCYEPTVEAVTATDKIIGDIYEACKQNGYVLFVTSDHGNAEKMLNDGNPHTAHTCAPVPFNICTKDFAVKKELQDKLVGGKLGDVAPTILTIMGLDVPSDMTGDNLVQEL